jgi:predicted nucleic acid-binding protein
MIVADASVVLKWFLPDEPGTDEALELRDRHVLGTDAVAVPALLEYEVANTLALTPRLSEPEALRAWDALTDIDLLAYSADNGQVRRAIRLARTAKVSVHDAAYVALAEALKCDFVTADARLGRKLAHQKLKCRVRVL